MVMMVPALIADIIIAVVALMIATRLGCYLRSYRLHVFINLFSKENRNSPNGDVDSQAQSQSQDNEQSQSQSQNNE